MNPGRDAGDLSIEVTASADLPDVIREEVIRLCDAAYGESLAPLFATFPAATHVIARGDRGIVSHAMWVTRRLAAGDGAPLRTAYVEMVATRPDAQRRGYASRVMERLAAAIPPDYDLAALCPATVPFYARLGWRLWRGPLSIRTPDGALLPTPEERVMILELPGRPPVDPDLPLSAEWREGELW